MKKKLTFMLLFLCLLSGCEKQETQKAPVVCVAAEDCFLCGRREEEPWGQENVGLISLNTFEMIPIEINRYGDGGELIEEKTGHINIWAFQSQENGFQTSVIEDVDRGVCHAEYDPRGDMTADREKAAAFLCRDHLEQILPEGGAEREGLGAVDLTTGEVEAFDRRTLGFGVGDFYVHCDWKEKGERLELLVFYSLLRYG